MSEPFDPFRESVAWVPDTGLFIACGRQQNNKYTALERYARQNDLRFVIPQRVHDELGGAPDRSTPGQTPINSAIDASWVNVVDEPDYTDSTVLQVIDHLWRAHTPPVCAALPVFYLFARQYRVMTDRVPNRQYGSSRRAFLTGSTAATVALSGCSGLIGSSGGDTLRVSTWSGTNETVFKEVIKPRYEEQTGNTLEVTGNWQGILSKIRQSPENDPPFDVTVGAGRTNYRGEQDGLWEPVEYDNLSNAGSIKPRLREYQMAETGVPIAYGVHAYVYNENTASWNPESWADIQSAEAENLALPSDFWLKLFMMAALLRDDEPLADEVYDRQYMDALLKTIEGLPVSTFYQGTQGLWTALGEGLADVSHYFFAYGLKRAQTTDKYPIGVTVPEPTSAYIDYYQIVRGTDRKPMAEEFIDFLLDPEIQSAYAAEFNLGFSNEETDHPDLTAESIPTTNEELGQVAFQNFARVAEFSGDMSDRFRAVVQDN